jgi:MYXO-CTERM domain-containing protein
LVVGFTPVTHNEVPGTSGTDEYWIVVTGPNGVSSPGSAGTTVLNFGSISGLSSFSYVFTSTAGSGNPNASGPLSLTGSDSIVLDLTATVPGGNPGDPFDHYILQLGWTTSGSSGGGYAYSIAIDPCGSGGCASTVVPVPPAAVLFVSALAGLGLLGRRRRKSAHDLTGQA